MYLLSASCLGAAMDKYVLQRLCGHNCTGRKIQIYIAPAVVTVSGAHAYTTHVVFCLQDPCVWRFPASRQNQLDETRSPASPNKKHCFFEFAPRRCRCRSPRRCATCFCAIGDPAPDLHSKIHGQSHKSHRARCLWPPEAGASGRKWPQVAASGRN